MDKFVQKRPRAGFEICRNFPGPDRLELEENQNFPGPDRLELEENPNFLARGRLGLEQNQNVSQHAYLPSSSTRYKLNL